MWAPITNGLDAVKDMSRPDATCVGLLPISTHNKRLGFCSGAFMNGLGGSEPMVDWWTEVRGRA